jgi:transposase
VICECHEAGASPRRESARDRYFNAKEAEVEYVGIDWASRRAAWCALDPAGELLGEGVIAADRDGLTRLVARRGLEVSAAVEMMSGAVWVADTLRAGGWRVQVADARKAKALAPLAAKTDRIDAHVLAELCRRELVPEVWVASLEDRALRERLLRRMHLVRLRTSAKNRIFGLLSQWGLRVSVKRLRQADGLLLLERLALPEVWRASVAEALALVELLDERIGPIEAELAPLALADGRVQLLRTIPGVGSLLGLTVAAEIGEIARFPSPSKLVGYSGLVPRVHQSGESSRTGRLSKAGSPLLRWAAVEAAQQGWRPQNPWHRLYVDVRRRQGNGNAAKAAVARKVLIACWHVLARNEPFKPAASSAAPIVPASSSTSLAA